MKVIINCGKSDILKSKQVVSLAKLSNKFFLINSFNAFNLHHQHPHAVCNCLLFYFIMLLCEQVRYISCDSCRTFRQKWFVHSEQSQTQCHNETIRTKRVAATLLLSVKNVRLNFEYCSTCNVLSTFVSLRPFRCYFFLLSRRRTSSSA